MTNAYLQGYQPGGVINFNGAKMFREIIAPFSRGPKAGVSNRSYAVHEKVLIMSARALYYNRAKPSVSRLKNHRVNTILMSERGWNSRKLTQCISLSGISARKRH